MADDSRAYPGRLHHDVPYWVTSGSCFHIRLRAEAPPGAGPLTAPVLASALLQSAEHYHTIGRWHCRLFLLMPDHAHAMLSFPPEKRMARAISDWKRYTATQLGVAWQTNFFDHRLRNESEADEKWHYIRRNPVVRASCAQEEDWPWVWWPGKDQRGKT